jgi:hypothetical protein
MLERAESEALSIRCAVAPGDARPGRPAFPLVIKGGVEVRGFEPLASSVRVVSGPPLCRPAFPQLDPDRKRRGYVA